MNGTDSQKIHMINYKDNSYKQNADFQSKREKIVN